ncbi:glutamic acid-rich region [Angomonas deanei]|uniref:Uncharacterized protein n=1 Tax=Angomonas deanei TaxID=59799 RepID=A0A7G2BYY4_9TRYP|nr:glutamic acid-rich region [Angomonas deanei]CAD2212718.1 hypothetical protein, conserved [Angomonas deanei]|eukprot:EPY21335.1 glutamic acid-rich region [Angomonas deanei]
MTEDYPSEKKALRLLTLACPDADPELREELAYLVSARRRTIDDAVQFLHDKDLKAQQLKKEEEEKQKEKARLQEKLKKQEEERKKEQARKEAEAAEAAKAKAAQREAMKAANGTTGMPDPTIEMLGDTPLTEAEKDMVKMVHYFLRKHGGKL